MHCRSVVCVTSVACLAIAVFFVSREEASNPCVDLQLPRLGPAMKIAVLGATGRTGLCLLQQALELGHTVTAVARSPEKITQRHDSLKVVRADVFSAAELGGVFKDHDAVLSTLGFSRKTTSDYTDSMKAVVQAMRTSNVHRLVIMTAQNTDYESAKSHGFIIYRLFMPFIRNMLLNMQAMEQWLEADVSDLAWTVVKPGGLNNNALDKQTLLQEQGAQLVSDARAASYISRANVARFMLEQLADEQHVRKAVSIAVAK